MRKIAVGCDHAAYEFKEKAVAYLKKKGYQVEDFGTYSEESVDYPDYIYPAVKSVSESKNDIGIVMCGSGIGASITANKVKDIRAALVYDPEIAKITREHNNSNVLVLGPRFTKDEVLFEIMDNWLSTDFSNDPRHNRRIEKLAEVEENER